MNNILEIIGRDSQLFEHDISDNEKELSKIISGSTFLVLGAAGSIGAAVAKEIFTRNPRKMHLVDISENNMVEVVRDLRSSVGYCDGEFRTFALDIGSEIYDAFYQSDGNYDYVLNLSALKHVRSEKDPFTLMRMIEVNIGNTDKTINQAKKSRAKKYFCVSTDKAANPVNMMGASKRIMEMYLANRAGAIPISTARFANVAFSDGSLLHGFNQRIIKRQPLAAPTDITRYFVSGKESGELCLLSCLTGANLDVYFPKNAQQLKLTSFSDIAIRFLRRLGYEAFVCETEDEARSRVEELAAIKKWPCYFFRSDTTGEKRYEEFYTADETLDLKRFENIGIIKNIINPDSSQIDYFSNKIQSMRSAGIWSREDLIGLFNEMIPNFKHKQTGKFLDDRM